MRQKTTKRGCDVLVCIRAFVRLKPHAHMQNALPRVMAVQREAARFAYQTPNSFGGRGGGAKLYVTPTKRRWTGEMFSHGCPCWRAGSPLLPMQNTLGRVEAVQRALACFESNSGLPAHENNRLRQTKRECCQPANSAAYAPPPRSCRNSASSAAMRCSASAARASASSARTSASSRAATTST